jgi:O-methyltransferase
VAAFRRASGLLSRPSNGESVVPSETREAREGSGETWRTRRTGAPAGANGDRFCPVPGSPSMNFRLPFRRPDKPEPEKSDPVPVPRLVNDTVAALARDHASVSWGDRLLTLDKSAGFKDEPGFARAFAEIRGSHQYDQYDGPDSIAWRLNTLIWAGRCALRTGGDFVECGTFKGDMAWVVLQTIGADLIPRFWLFDSFDGFSPDLSSPDDFPENRGFFDFANGFYRQPGLYESVRDRFAPFANVNLVKGFLPEALDIAMPGQIGFLHVDLNSPRAELAVLARLFDQVVPGGVIVFDDYGWKLFHAQKELEDDFMLMRGYQILELPTGQGLVVKR